MNTPAAPSRSWFATHPSLAPGPLRILMGILSFVGLFALLVLVPVVALPSWLRLPPGDSAAWSVGASTLILWGTLLALLYGAKVVSRPTRLFGPLIVAASGAALLYLVSILPLADVTLARAGASPLILTIGYGPFLLLAMVVPSLKILSGLLVTLEDVRYPGSRISREFPRGAA